MSTQDVAVLGTYQSDFRTHDMSQTYVEQVQKAAIGAHRDAGMCVDDVDAAVISLAPTFFLGVADADRWAIDNIVCAGKPVLRVHTGGATGGSAVHIAYSLIQSRMARSVLIVGAERIAETPDAQKVLNLIFDAFYERDMPLSTNTLVALRACAYLHRHGFTQEDLARVVVRARRNAMKNPHAHLKGDITVDDVMASKMIAYPLKLFDICPRSSGCAAMILGNMDMAKRYRTNPAFVNGIGSLSDTYWMGDRTGPTADTDLVEYDLIRMAATTAYRRAGVTDPLKQIQVAEFYDPYSVNTPISLEQAGFCSRGTALRLEKDGYWDRDTGAVAVNPSGGTLCTNPIAITGLVRCIDAATQVMGTAGDMQVRNVRRALATASGGTAQFYNCTVFGAEPTHG
ncbi:thiolase family protein [Chelatococcus reniformis]|uniref:3-ketoacyl-CoA thiolase n=1 Tax=Chelatococcus reniformis TaxID=1494448 RepID=A0A916UYS4_9HYPH|nr:thiolase family protein [Chelatococcus reniformis]GGC93974.1 3-ketoacyl-CoA thiolase [Chelatococcus reniformis]